MKHPFFFLEQKVGMKTTTQQNTAQPNGNLMHFKTQVLWTYVRYIGVCYARGKFEKIFFLFFLVYFKYNIARCSEIWTKQASELLIKHAHGEANLIMHFCRNVQCFILTCKGVKGVKSLRDIRKCLLCLDKSRLRKVFWPMEVICPALYYFTYILWLWNLTKKWGIILQP